MVTGQNPVKFQADIERLTYRTTLKDEARLRATGQVKVYLTQINKYTDKKFTGKTFITFHDAINKVITGEEAWVMKNRLAGVLGREIKDQELIRDYFPAIPLQRYIAISEAAANLMIQQKLHPITAVEQAASIVLPAGYIPTPINFVEHIKTVKIRVTALESGQTSLSFP